MSRTDEKLNVLDYLQLIWFDYLIKSKAKKDLRCVYVKFTARERVYKRLKKIGYTVYIYSSGVTAIRW